MKIKRKDLQILIENLINELGPVASKDVFITYTVQKGDNLKKIADLIPYGTIGYGEEIQDFLESGDMEKIINSSLNDAEFEMVFDQEDIIPGYQSLSEFIVELFIEDIIDANNLSDPNKISIGQKLKIPIDGPSSSVANRLAKGRENRNNYEDETDEFQDSGSGADLKLGR